MSIKQLSEPAMARIEFTVAAVITVAAITLHILVLQNAGGLWRDEAGLVHLAALPHLADVWHLLVQDSFPMLVPSLIRFWTAIGFGGSDFGLRMLGFLIGAGLLSAIWISARCLGLRAPVLALALVAVNVSVIRWGDSLRGYGCGSIFILLTLGLVWRQAKSPSPGRWALASFAALLSVQTLYQNAFLLLAICCGSAAVCLLRKQAKTAGSLLAIGVSAAFSLMPYARPIIAAQDFWVLHKINVDSEVIWENLGQLLPDSLAVEFRWVWLLMVIMAIGIGLRSLMQQKEARPVMDGDLPLFAAFTLLAAIGAFFVYLKVSGLCKSWYFIPFLAVTVLCAEAALGPISSNFRWWRLIIVAVLACAPYSASVHAASSANTNADAVAAELQKRAQPDDLILVYPWYCGISFGRYFKGNTAWMTIPEISDHRFHRYDLVKEKIQTPLPMTPIFDRIKATLSSGGHVWVVGGLPTTPPPPSPLPGPWPNVPNGWWEAYHTFFWGQLAAEFMNGHAEKAELIEVASASRAGSTSRLESLPLYMVSGWKE